MAPVTQVGVPAEATCGDTWKFYVPSFGEYPISESWTPSLSFVGAGVLHTESGELTNDGNTWTCTIPASRTITLDSKAGSYEWHLFFTGAGAFANQRYEADSGRITVCSNPANAVDGDFQSQDEKDLAVLEAAYAGRLSEPMKAYTIRGRQVVLWEPSEIRAEIGRLRRAMHIRKHGSIPVLKRFWYAA